MSLFQKSVLNKYLNEQDKNAVSEAFEKYSTYFFNPVIQQNINDSKEEQFQEGFLRELFVNVFGYVLNPHPDFNLTTELKNEKGAKKADGAILKDGKAIAVIELKSTKTKDLESIRQQAFDYKANQSECVYVITSNFQKIRFYVNNAVEFEEFDLFTLSEDRFQVLLLCLSSENLLSDLPLKIKNASLLEEENITKKFYADYSLFKKELFESISTKNIELEGVSKLQLYKKTQKLLDRFLFIFFAEDRGLLPPNSISRMIKRWNVLNDEDAYKPLYDIYKQYFGYLNIGRKGKVPSDDIQAYNGGLFLTDEILDSIEIDDEILLKHTSVLTNYDFDSQVDVNILGHIFEHSLNEIESTTAELEGVDFDKQKSKRKKDGVFYTPKYITKYIVDNTVGKLCEEKRTEFGIIDEELAPNRKQGTKKKLLASLEAYREWLLELTICDPACGSGAFLNQALEFLINEHYYIDELNAQLFGSTMVFQDVENQILEKNIFGVDINEESVDIARLSLWLRTAQRGRKLTTLNKNIKCGNSLIDDPEVAGDKAFNWEKEFPEVFANGGFDVVIGNPPYVRQELLSEIKPYLERNYKVFDGTTDLFAYFYERSFLILKKKGYFGFISNTFDKTKAASKLREYLQSKTDFINYVDFTEVQIFEGATTYPVIVIAQNKYVEGCLFKYIKIPKSSQTKIINIDSEASVDVAQNSLESESWGFNSIQQSLLLEKIKQFKSIRSQFGKCFRGIVTGYNDAFIIDMFTRELLEKEHYSSKELIKPFYEGKDMSKWHTPKIEKYLIFTRRGTNIDQYPSIKRYLEKNEERLTPRNSPDIKTGRKPGPYKWYEIQDSVDYFKVFEGEKITWPNLQSANKFCLENNKYYINAPSVVFPSNNKTLLCILNSKLTWFFLKSICVIRSGGYIEVKPQYFEQIPIPELRNEEAFNKKADEIINYTSEFQTAQSNFINLLQSKFDYEKPGKKLQNWHELDFKEFLIELRKVKVKLSLSEEAEWMEYFSVQKQKAKFLKSEINKTEKEIDQMVYELYGLTEEEISIVENK